MVNSKYVQKCLDNSVWTWECNNWYLLDDDHSIQYSEVVQRLHTLISWLGQEGNMAIRFWKVGKRDVAGAEKLVRSTFS